MFARYIGGIIGLTKDAVRFVFYLLKRPHYVALLLAAVIGLFYLNGVPPREIAPLVSEKWQAFVENRKKTFNEDKQLLLARFGPNVEKNAPKAEKTVPAVESEDVMSDTLAELMSDMPVSRPKPKAKPAIQDFRQMEEETFGWKQAFQEAKKEKNEIPDEKTIHGFLTVVSADKVRIGEKTFSLKAKLYPGKAGEAYQQLKRRFDGRKAKCVPDDALPDKVECFVGGIGASEMLVDFGLADPI